MSPMYYVACNCPYFYNTLDNIFHRFFLLAEVTDVVSLFKWFNVITSLRLLGRAFLYPHNEKVAAYIHGEKELVMITYPVG